MSDGVLFITRRSDVLKLVYSLAIMGIALYFVTLVMIARVAICGPSDLPGPRLGGKFVIVGCP